MGLVAPWHVGLQFPDRGSNPHPLHWQVASQLLDNQGIQIVIFNVAFVEEGGWGKHPEKVNWAWVLPTMCLAVKIN